MLQTAQNLPESFNYSQKKETGRNHDEINKNLKSAIWRNEFKENVELLYASSIFMSSKDCASWTCD